MDSFSAPSSDSSQFSANEFRDQLKTQLAQAYAEEFLEVQFSPTCFFSTKLVGRVTDMYVRMYVYLDFLEYSV